MILAFIFPRIASLILKETDRKNLHKIRFRISTESLPPLYFVSFCGNPPNYFPRDLAQYFNEFTPNIIEILHSN